MHISIDILIICLCNKLLSSWQVLVGGNSILGSVGPAPTHDSEDCGPSSAEKKRPSEQNFNAWLSDAFGKDEGSEGAIAAEDGAVAGTARAGPLRGAKRSRPMSDAAVVKANRERARRERLNEYLDELSRLCDPSGKGTKADRVSVVADAIRVVQQLRVENNQLKQLNKFLEERMGQYERTRAESMFQQAALVMGHQGLSLAGQQPTALGPGSVASTLGLREAQPGRVDGTLPPISADARLTAVEQTREAMPMPTAMPGATATSLMHVLVPVPMASRADTSLLAFKQDGVLPPGAPQVSWLPAPDLSQDQKLRPPAA